MEASEFHSRVMASDLHVVTIGGPPGLGDEALAGLQRLEALWSRFVATSDISRLNRSPGIAVEVAADTLTLIATMTEGWYVTSGRYDPTVLPVLVANGYAASRLDPLQRTVLPDAVGRSASSLGDVRIDARASTVTLPQGMALDPGGIGKGLAADLIVAQLLAHGARGALVAIGGDLSMAGDPPHSDGWFVQVERPDPVGGALCTIAVSSGGVATSSTTSRRWVGDGLDHHHLIDPLTGAESDTDLAAVTVVAPTGWAAEAHATGALLAGSDGVLAYLEGHGLSGIAISHLGPILTTDDLASVVLSPAGGVR